MRPVQVGALFCTLPQEVCPNSCSKNLSLSAAMLTPVEKKPHRQNEGGSSLGVPGEHQVKDEWQPCQARVPHRECGGSEPSPGAQYELYLQ